MRSKTLLTVTVLGGVAALALTGCSPNTTGGSATTASSATTTSSASSIANPLDTTKLQQDLCTGLTPAQLAPYMGEVRKTSPDKDSKSSACLLSPADNGLATISVIVFPNLTVSAMIASGSGYPYSKNLDPVQGYPAQDNSQGNPPHGECGTTVSVADHVAVAVEAQASEGYQYYSNMCAVSEALVPMLISNIKASG